MAEFKIVTGDLLSQNVDVIVNAWNVNIIPWWLLIPQGVSGAIKKKAGYKPFRELPLKPMALGSAVMTSAGKLEYKAIIHVAGINLLWRASRKSIQNSVINALNLAQEKGFKSIAFPIIGAGSGCFNEESALKLIVETLESSASPMDIIVVKFKPN